jgi:N-acetylneuraminic acid mutarotase
LWIGRRVLAAVVTTLAAAACGNGAAPAPSDPFATEGTGSWGPVAVAPADADPVLPQMFFTGTEVLLASNGLFSYDPAKDSWSDLNNPALFSPIDAGPLGPNTVGPFAPGNGAVVWTGQMLLSFGGEGCGYLHDSCPTAFAYDPTTNRFTSISMQGAPSPREGAVALWTGSRMLIWGGYDSVTLSSTSYEEVTYNDGGLYDPVADAWTAISGATAPQPRQGHSAVWTSTEMIIWGGQLDMAGTVPGPAPGTIPDASPVPQAATVGMAYRPDTDTWSPISTKGQPSPRSGHAAVWTGAEMIIWGGGALPNPNNIGEALTDGAAYNPTTDTWRPIHSAPSTGLFVPAVVWTGAAMIVWGGYNEQSFANQGYRYAPATDSWEYLTTVNAPGPRAGAAAVWTGQSLMIWGGSGDFFQFSDGASWSPNAAEAGP